MFTEAPHLQVHVAQDAQHLMVLPIGEIDYQSSSMFRRSIVEGLGLGATSVTVDAGAIRFIDASGLHALTTLHRRIVRRGGRFNVSRPSPMLTRLVGLTGLGYLLEA